MSHKKKPKSVVHPSVLKEPRTAEMEAGRVRWSFAIYDNFQWGNDTVARKPFCELAIRLKETESRTWRGIDGNPKRDHHALVCDLSARAQKRLVEIKQDDAESLWRLRFSGQERLWGIRAGSEFRILWWDPEHQVLPVGKKHT